MIPVQHREIILDVASSKGIVDNCRTNGQNECVHTTIRRDLQKLEQQEAVGAGVPEASSLGTRGA
ncbi:hypothetical protein ACNKHU_16555 [Shigella flexneri]